MAFHEVKLEMLKLTENLTVLETKSVKICDPHLSITAEIITLNQIEETKSEYEHFVHRSLYSVIWQSLPQGWECNSDGECNKVCIPVVLRSGNI